jgi:hypothetical protein
VAVPSFFCALQRKKALKIDEKRVSLISFY